MSYDIETEPEKDYDDIAKLAAQICQAPYSLITIFGQDGNWCKSGYGFTALSKHLVSGTLTTLISDSPGLVGDTRFAQALQNDPLVSEEYRIVSYACVALTDPQGFMLGSLSVLGNLGNTFTALHVESLQALSNQVVNLLLLKKANKGLLSGQNDLTFTASKQAQMQQALDESKV